MPSNQRIFSPGVRKRKAYYTAFRVFVSYYWLYLKSKVFGKNYYAKRIKALHLKNADRIKNKVQELQGLFIKVGQLISNLSNILPEEFRVPLEALQDHVEAKPYAEIEQTILKELGKKPEGIFTEFQKTPLAAASIGQVHRAVLDGKEVVVKVQHHNIDIIAQADLQILENLVKLHGFFMDMQGLDHTYEQVKLMIEEELDYKKEAASMRQIAEDLKEVPDLQIKIPQVNTQYNTQKVLISEFCEGVKIGNVKEIEDWGLNLEDLAKRLIELYCKMILVDGFYHADPHPGNILVNPQGQIILLDFGAVARLSESTKKAIPELIEAVVKNDTEAIVLALKNMGFLGSDKASRKFVEKLIDIFKEFLKEEVELDGLNFQNVKLKSGLSSIASIIRKVDLRAISKNIRIPKEYILLNRTIVLLIGNAFRLAPELDTLEVLQPYLKKHILDKDGSFTQMIVNTFKNQITTAVSLPNELSKFLKTANENDMEEEIKELHTTLQKIHNLGQQIFYFLLLAAFVYFLMHYDFEDQGWLKTINQGLIGISALLLVRAFFKNVD